VNQLSAENAAIKVAEKLKHLMCRCKPNYPSDLYDRMLGNWERHEKVHYARANGLRKAIEVL
jgi:hypothetical protein